MNPICLYVSRMVNVYNGSISHLSPVIQGPFYPSVLVKLTILDMMKTGTAGLFYVDQNFFSPLYRHPAWLHRKKPDSCSHSDNKHKCRRLYLWPHHSRNKAFASAYRLLYWHYCGEAPLTSANSSSVKQILLRLSSDDKKLLLILSNRLAGKGQNT